jgi:maltooligosyltrehalose trehalohydrolase
MKPVGGGYFQLRTDVPDGSRYGYCIGGVVYPDPASSWQPEGVHGLSAVPDFSFSWTDDGFSPVALSDLVIYELHVGTFTSEGTFDAAAGRLAELAETGFTAIELMPVAQFPGSWNWGYDGVYPWSVQESYGGPKALQSFVDQAHSVGLSVLLDVVFNHLGPEGNYSRQFGPYFTDRYSTPWGEALNFDGPGSDGVRSLFLGASHHLLTAYHLDGFRLDAVHEIHDESGEPFLRQVGALANAVGERTGKQRLVIAESDLNDRRIVEPAERNGLGLASSWADDFHHAMHRTLTGEARGYYEDYADPQHLARTIEHGWSYSWEFSPSRGRHHGSSAKGLPSSCFVFCTQNHDQIGNRMLGERMVALAGHAADRASRFILLLSPAIPLVFMGQEYGEEAPFLYFVDHSDPGLLAATREGRAREFAAFHSGNPPDPGNSATRAASVLSWQRRAQGDDLLLTRELLRLRRSCDCFAAADTPRGARAVMSDGVLISARKGASGIGLVVANLTGEDRTINLSRETDAGSLEQWISGSKAEKPGALAPQLVLGRVAQTGVDSGHIDLAPYSALACTTGYPAEEYKTFNN